MRIFFGLSLPGDTRRAVESLALRAQALVPGRYAIAGNHHLTLAFLGDVPRERLPEAQAILVRCAAAFPAPRITIEGAGFFGTPQNAILILRARGTPCLSPLHDALAAALARAELPCSPGPFAPHVTLARHARIDPAALARLDGDAARIPAFCVPCAHLFLSARDEENVLRYTPLAEAAFHS